MLPWVIPQNSPYLLLQVTTLGVELGKKRKKGISSALKDANVILWWQELPLILTTVTMIIEKSLQLDFIIIHKLPNPKPESISLPCHFFRLQSCAWHFLSHNDWLSQRCPLDSSYYIAFVIYRPKWTWWRSLCRVLRATPDSRAFSWEQIFLPQPTSFLTPDAHVQTSWTFSISTQHLYGSFSSPSPSRIHFLGSFLIYLFISATSMTPDLSSYWNQ